MSYGNQKVDYMDKRSQKLANKKHTDSLPDQAGSIEPRQMEGTYRDCKTGKYLYGVLRVPGAKVVGFKDARMGITVPTKDMTHILSSEALATGAAPMELKPGMVIASDALGVYSPSLKTVLKKNNPLIEIGQQEFSLLRRFARIQNNATAYVKEGKLSSGRAEEIIKNAWTAVQNLAQRISHSN